MSESAPVKVRVQFEMIVDVSDDAVDMDEAVEQAATASDADLTYMGYEIVNPWELEDDKPFPPQ